VLLLFNSCDDSKVSCDFLYEWRVWTSWSFECFESLICFRKLLCDLLVGRLSSDRQVLLFKGGFGVIAWVEAVLLVTLTMLMEIPLSSLSSLQ
jgi:hypothetical protein